MRKIYVMVICGLIVTGSLSAQGAPVMDAAHILESIHNGYQIYLQVQGMLQEMEYLYKSMEAQMLAIQQFDYSSIDSFRDAVSYVDRQLSWVRNAENRLRNMSIKVGDQNYNLLQLYEVPGATMEQLEHDMTKDMSLQDRARAWSHYGLSPANYIYTRTWEARTQSVAQVLAAMSDSAEDSVSDSASRAEQLINAVRVAESPLAVQQALAELTALNLERMNQMYLQQSAQGQLESDRAMASMGGGPERMKASTDFLE